MPKCSKCNKPQSKLNKGALCKECFHNKINKVVSNETTEPELENEFITETIDDDRYIIDMMKDYMTRERDLNNDLINHLKEEILYLKDELLHKNILIDRLFSDFKNDNHTDENCRNNYDISPTCNEQYSTNDDLIDPPRITISPDDSLCTDNTAYNNIENDDVLLSDRNFEWRSSSKSHRRNKSVINNERNTVEHPNQFRALFNNADDAVNDINSYDNNFMNGNFTNKPTRTNNQDRANASHIKRPHVVTQEYPENNHVIKPIRPGDNTYSEALKDGKVTVIFSTSITKGIKVREFNNHYKLGIARFRRFHGAKARQMKHYVIPTLIEEKPKIVMLQCGGNDLATSKHNPTPVENIAKKIIETAQICENFGAENIFICGVITRIQGYMDRRRIKLNEILRDICYDSGYNFVNNDNITHENLSQDGVHLNVDGSVILANNLLHSLNNNY